MDTETNRRAHRACFTGHRPEKILLPHKEIEQRLETAIINAINDGTTVFISGMSRGIDIWASEIIIKLKRKYHDIKLVCAVPYEGFEDRWEASWKRKYKRILKKSDWTYYACDSYAPNCFQKRNEWMVDHSNLVIAHFNGSSGGTKNTILYAQKQNVRIVFI